MLISGHISQVRPETATRWLIIKTAELIIKKTSYAKPYRHSPPDRDARVVRPRPGRRVQLAQVAAVEPAAVPVRACERERDVAAARARAALCDAVGHAADVTAARAPAALVPRGAAATPVGRRAVAGDGAGVGTAAARDLCELRLLGELLARERRRQARRAARAVGRAPRPGLAVEPRSVGGVTARRRQRAEGGGA
eukprot:scaffold9443_cov67-Phaeocystis_antarctica.AAC.2